MWRLDDTITHMGRLVDIITPMGRLVDIITHMGRLFDTGRLVETKTRTEGLVDTITHMGRLVDTITERKLSTFVTQKYDQLLFRIVCKEALICIYINLARIVSNLFLMLQKYRPNMHCQ